MERGYPYEFTLDELGENVGLKVKNNSRGYEIVNNALTLLVPLPYTLLKFSTFKISIIFPLSRTVYKTKVTIK